jgi:hypothetical protein
VIEEKMSSEYETKPTSTVSKILIRGRVLKTFVLLATNER